MTRKSTSTKTASSSCWRMTWKSISSKTANSCCWRMTWKSTSTKQKIHPVDEWLGNPHPPNSKFILLTNDLEIHIHQTANSSCWRMTWKSTSTKTASSSCWRMTSKSTSTRLATTPLYSQSLPIPQVVQRLRRARRRWHPVWRKGWWERKSASCGK